MRAVLAILMVPLGIVGALLILVMPFSGFADGFTWETLGLGALGLVLMSAYVLCGIGINKLTRKTTP